MNYTRNLRMYHAMLLSSALVCGIAADSTPVTPSGAGAAIAAFFSRLWTTIKTDVSAVLGWGEQAGEDALLAFWTNILKPLLLNSEPKVMQDVLTVILAYMLNASPAQKAADLAAVEADFNTFVASVKPELVTELEALGSQVVQGLLSIILGLLTTGKLVLPAI